MLTKLVCPQLRKKIHESYKANMARYPQKEQEVETYLSAKGGDLSLCLRYLYGHMPANDVLSFPVEMIAGYAEASLQAWETIDYVKTIPLEIYLPYVLHHRVNSECLDGSRGMLMAWIRPHIQGKDMRQAALAVNYWCYAHATYTPADDRTLGPLAVMRRTLGRCGEESVLAVAALRSVGIPARQCYCPRWSHCDDNHAWVEVWVDGDWHYMGACEPEPELDRGWFTAAASKAMLVHTKQWAHWEGPEVLRSTPIYQEMHCTTRYAQQRMLTVQVCSNGLPLQGVAVAFQIVNYSELYTIHRGITDAEGTAQFLTGLGDLCVSIYHNNRMWLKKVDMRQQETALVLELNAGVELNAMPERIRMDLVPPLGKSDVAAKAENADHERKLQLCQDHREGIMAAFTGKLPVEAAGNWQQVQAFLHADAYSQEEKQALLQTLRPKDFVDITCETLKDALDTANLVRGQYPEAIFRDYILAPRIADEMLLPNRAKIRALFPDGFADPGQILAWMRTNVQIVDGFGVDNYYPDAYGCLYYRQVPAFCFDMVFVALCRAFCFPARLAPDTGKGQWLDDAFVWHSIHKEADEPKVMLKLVNPNAQPLSYYEHITVGQWNGEEFVTMRYPEMILERQWDLHVAPGMYRIITTTRQIDGTASVALHHVHVDADKALVLDLPEDQTAQRLQQVLLHLERGEVKNVLAELTGQKSIVIFADPGSEPTEHLLQEMLECADGFCALGCPIRIFVDHPQKLCNGTLRRVEKELAQVTIQVCRDPEGEAALHRQMQVGDLRLPFVVALDAQGRGVYACANYNIRMAQTLLRIQMLTQ